MLPRNQSRARRCAHMSQRKGFSRRDERANQKRHYLGCIKGFASFIADLERRLTGRTHVGPRELATPLLFKMCSDEKTNSIK